MFCNSLQNNAVKLNKDFFLLGTLDEYQGRYKREPKDVFVDMYYPHEGFVVRILDSLFREDYPDLDLEIEPSGHKNLHSQKLAYKVNKYFGIEGEKEKRIEGLATGAKLEKNIFKTDEQRYSYLAGVFLRYGLVIDGNFKIKFANSAGKVEVCKMLFEELGYTDVKFECVNNIPVSNVFSFIPKGELKTYILYAIELRDSFLPAGEIQYRYSV